MATPWIVSRYVFSDVGIHALLALAALTLLIVTGNVLRFLENLVEARVAPSALGQLMLAILPFYLCYSIPTALVFGTLITFGRMASDGEINALQATGLSRAAVPAGAGDGSGRGARRRLFDGRGESTQLCAHEAARA